MSVIKGSRLTLNRRLLVFVVLAIALFFVFSGYGGKRAQALPDDAYEQLQIFANVLAIVQKNYVEPVTTKQLVQGAISGMLSSLDPHSAYLTPDLYKDLQVETRGTFGGLGLEITIKDGVLTVVSPIEDTPAYRAGIKAGDQIIKINDNFTKDMSLTEAVKQMRGPKGTTVRLTIHREGVPQLFTVTLTRDIIRIQSVKFKTLKNGIGDIRITSFQENTDENVHEALEKLAKADGGKIKGLILDLRDNPGGLLNQAVRVAGEFLNGGLVVYTEGRTESQQQKYFAQSHPNFYAFPMVVLVNSGSASASEIVAGALQDHRRAVIVGTQTFGKGSVQTILPLDDRSALRLTTARYYTPNGRSIQAVGITPDVIVEEPQPTVAMATIPGAVEEHPVIREKDLPHHFTNGEKEEPSSDHPPNNAEPPRGAQPGPGSKAPKGSGQLEAKAGAGAKERDLQLERAIAILEHWESEGKPILAKAAPMPGETQAKR